MQATHDLREFSQRKSHLGTCSEMLQSEVDGICASLDGGVKLRPVSGRRHYFGFDETRRKHGIEILNETTLC
jgi:hypothetical protein